LIKVDFMRPSAWQAIVITVALGLWMASGTSATRSEHQGKSTPSKAVTMRVKVHPSVAQPITRQVTVNGQLEPARSVILRAEIEGRVVDRPLIKGHQVEPGMALVRLAMDDRAARLAEAETDLAKRQADLSATRTLYEKRVAPESHLKGDVAALSAAKARMARIQWEMDKIVIKAPFGGVLNEMHVEIGSFVQVGDPIATVVDNHALLLTAQVPQLSVLQLKLGQPVEAHLINDEVLSGTLTYISAQASGGTRSFRIEATVPNPKQRPVSGLSASLRLPLGKIMGHKVTPSALSLNTQGQLEIKGVDDNNQVVSYPVSRVRNDHDGIWVDNLPDTVQVIVVGHHFVQPGETVTPIVEAGE
jgi:multidrug efflux system membrane fusion protein